MDQVNNTLQVALCSIVFLALLIINAFTLLLRKFMEWEKRNDKDEH